MATDTASAAAARSRSDAAARLVAATRVPVVPVMSPAISVHVWPDLARAVILSAISCAPKTVSAPIWSAYSRTRSMSAPVPPRAMPSSAILCSKSPAIVSDFLLIIARGTVTPAVRPAPIVVRREPTVFSLSCAVCRPLFRPDRSQPMAAKSEATCSPTSYLLRPLDRAFAAARFSPLRRSCACAMSEYCQTLMSRCASIQSSASTYSSVQWVRSTSHARQ